MDIPALRDAQQPSVAPKKDFKSTRMVGGQPSRFVLLHDLAASLKAPGFWLYGAWLDESLRHRSQVLGAFWGVAGTLLLVVLLGTLYSQILNTRGGASYYAHLATGYVSFIFVQKCLATGARVFSQNRSTIENGYVKYADYVLRMFCAQLVNLGYNLIVVVGAIVLVPVVLTPAALVLFVTVPLFLLATLGACFLLAVVGARYSDFVELLRTLLRIAFFVTPILWLPHAVGGKSAIIGPFLYANPFYYLIEIIRAPLVYAHVPWLEIGVVAAAIPVIWLLAILVYARARPYIPLWV